MALFTFHKPDKVVIHQNENFFGKFELKPLEPGFGATLGNALRRILLSSLTGYAITAVKIQGVDHEFSTVKGVLEDVTDIILNLKQVRFKPNDTSSKTNDERISVEVRSKNKLTAQMIGDATSLFSVTNPELIIFHCEESVTLQIDMIISQGRGYMLADDNKTNTLPIGFMPMDSIHTPIKNVKYYVESTRVGQRTDYEKLFVDISTDGTVDTELALREAAHIMMQHLIVVTEKEITREEQELPQNVAIDEQAEKVAQTLKTPLEDLDLSVRAFNCLKGAKITSLSELVRYEKEDLLRFRNFGQKSLDEINQVLQSKGLALGMDLTNVKI